METAANVTALGTGVAESNGFEPDPAIHYSYWVNQTWDRLTIWQNHPLSGLSGVDDIVIVHWEFSR